MDAAPGFAGGQQRTAQPDGRLHRSHRQPRQRLRIRSRHQLVRRPPAVRDDDGVQRRWRHLVDSEPSGGPPQPPPPPSTPFHPSHPHPHSPPAPSPVPPPPTPPPPSHPHT